MATPKNKDVKADERRPPLDEEKKREMLAVLIRNAEAYEAAQELLTVKEVKRWSEGMAVVWKLVRRFNKKFSELPDFGQLNAELHNETNANPDLLTVEELGEIDEFLQYAWDDKEQGKNVAKSKKHVRVAIDTCKQFLEENIATDFQQAIVHEGTVLVDIPKMLELTQLKLEQVRSMTELDLGVPFPPGWDTRNDQQLFTTGVEAFDTFMGGGYRAGEVILFMGPYGSCKTTLVCNGVANQLKYAASLVSAGKAKVDAKGNQLNPVVVLIFTESDMNEYRDRLMSNMARVPWKRLATMTSLEDLDDGDAPGAVDTTKYELTVFKDDIKNGRPWRNERQRVARATKLANKHLLILDCTDSEDSPYKVGAGGIQEIANVIKGVFRKRDDCYPVAFWLDHVSGLVDRMGDTIKDEAELRRVLTNIPRVAGEKLAKPFKAPIVLMHQFSGAVQNKGVVAKFHHNDAEGSKSIGKYAVFAFVSGSVDENGMCKWECTKHRREPPSKHRIVRVYGRFNRIIDCTHSYGINEGQRCIMKKSEMDTIAMVGNTNLKKITNPTEM